MDWYRGFESKDCGGSDSVEVGDHDAVVLGLSVSRHAEGAIPVRAHKLYQVATVAGGEVVDLRFYPGRHSVLGRI